jgi:hypothetical protein
MIFCVVQPAAATVGAAFRAPMTEILSDRADNVRASCKDVASCEEAVILWCNGYHRADADGDGVPCENVCSSKEEVDRIRAQIGC